jgi:DNA-binding MarR family transcriptional regulator
MLIVMPTWQPDLAPLVTRIPRLHYLLKALGDGLHTELGVTSAMRGVMVSLAAGEPRAVPELARERPVSRQHMQLVVNQLLAAGLAEALPNPAHRRSPRVGLTDHGRRRLKLLRDRETELLSRTAPAVSHLELAAAARLFDLLERDLQSRLDQALR